MRQHVYKGKGVPPKNGQRQISLKVLSCLYALNLTLIPPILYKMSSLNKS